MRPVVVVELIGEGAEEAVSVGGYFGDGVALV